MEFTLTFARLFLIELFHAGPILVLLGLVISGLGLIIGRIEGWSDSDALYHAFINATTVGYGDLRPTIGRAKILAVVNAFVGIVFFGIVVAIDVSAAVYAFESVMENGAPVVSGNLLSVP